MLFVAAVPLGHGLSAVLRAEGHALQKITLQKHSKLNHGQRGNGSASHQQPIVQISAVLCLVEKG